MYCSNCKRKIRDFDKACYARETNVYLCSLSCLTDYAHEELRCEPINSSTSHNTDYIGFSKKGKP